MPSQGDIEAFGLTTVALNRDTIEARRLQQEDLWETVYAGVAVILTNTELLSSRGFSRLTDNEAFATCLCALGVGEVHLLSTWGLILRPSLRQIGHVRARLPSEVPLIGLTGTPCTSIHTTSVCRFLGLHAGQLFSYDVPAYVMTRMCSCCSDL
jgi:superfamily II DNA helicase RecQ